MDELNKCQTCGKDAQANEYDHDDDVYLMICEDGHRHWVANDDEVWK